MDEMHHGADEIVITRSSGLQYTYLHLKKKTRAEDLANALKILEPAGVIGSEIFGYNTIDGNAPSVSEHLEDHPGFRTLVDHEMNKNSEFRRWTANGYNPNGLCGYNLLKTRMLANQVSGSSPSGPAASRGDGGNGEYGGGASNYDGDEQRPRSIPVGSGEEKSKRRRTVSPDGGGGMDASAVDLVKSILEESKRNNDDVRILWEKVLVNELTAKHQIALGEASIAHIKIQAEMEEGKAELHSMRQLMVTVIF